MSIIETLVTDRTQSDVDRWKALRDKGWLALTDDERAEWSAILKGAYNPTIDMNRVQEAMDYIVAELLTYGYSTPGYTSIDAWSVGDIPTDSQLEQYRKNVESIRAVLELMETTPEAPESMNGLTYQKANDIEKILVDVEFVINQIVKGMARSECFTFWSGNRPFPCASSDRGRTWEELDAMNTRWENWQVATWYLILYGNLKAEGVVE